MHLFESLPRGVQGAHLDSSRRLCLKLASTLLTAASANRNHPHVAEATKLPLPRQLRMKPWISSLMYCLMRSETSCSSTSAKRETTTYLRLDHIFSRMHSAKERSSCGKTPRCICRPLCLPRRGHFSRMTGLELHLPYPLLAIRLNLRDCCREGGSRGLFTCRNGARCREAAAFLLPCKVTVTHLVKGRDGCSPSPWSSMGQMPLLIRQTGSMASPAMPSSVTPAAESDGNAWWCETRISFSPVTSRYE